MGKVWKNMRNAINRVHNIERITAVLLVLVMVFGSLTIKVQADSVTAAAPSLTEGESQEAVKTCAEISDLIADTWEDDYFGTMVVDGENGDVSVDGEEEGQITDFTEGNRKRRSGSTVEQQVEEYVETLPEDSVYDVTENKDGDFEITAPYQTRRIIVEAPVGEDTAGACQVIFNRELGETVLQYDTEEAAENACRIFKARYGEDKCYPDIVYRVDDILENVENVGVCSWGSEYMGMDNLKGRAAGKRKVTVAILDTGIEKSNFLFKYRTISSQSRNFVDNNTNVSDNHGHGTHVAGIVADATPSNVEIMMLKISNKSGYSSLLTIKTALQYALNKGVDVVNMSLGFVAYNASECTYLDTLISKAYQKGIAICTSAGNSSTDTIFCYPACNKKTFAISAIESNGSLASYSNWGSLIDFTAPGSQILSASTTGGLIGMSGTSMSSPHIAAAVAYIKMLEPRLSVQGVYNELKYLCKDLGQKGKDNSYGWGCPIMTNLFDTGLKNKSNIVGSGSSAPKITSVKNVAKGIHVAWKKGNNTNKYYVYRKTGKGAVKKVATVKGSAASWTDKKVTQGKTYSYMIKAVKTTGTTGFSNMKQMMRLKQVQKLKLSGGRKKASLSWKKATKISGYQVSYSTSKNMKNAKKMTVSAGKSKATLTGLKSNKKYYIQVRTIKKSKGVTFASSWSDRKSITIK